MYGYQFYNMQQIALAWHFAKGVSALIIGATKASHLEDAVKALDVTLTAEDVAFLEELYIPHRIVGAIDHKDKQRRNKKKYSVYNCNRDSIVNTFYPCGHFLSSVFCGYSRSTFL